MLFTIIHALASLGLSAFFGYLLYVNVGPWYSLFAIAFVIPVFYILYIAVLIILFLVSLILSAKKAPDGPSRFFGWLLKQNDWLLLVILRVKIVMKGEELIPKKQRFLIVTNHRSNFDQMVMIKALKESPMVYISKPGNFRAPIAGPFIKAAGFMPINREDPKEGAKTIMKAVELIKENRASIAISPEGTRNKGEDILLPFHPGSFQTAVKSNCPIVIASINGTPQVHRKAPWRKSRVNFTVIKTLYPEDYQGMSTRDIANLSMNLIKDQLNKEGLIL
ncbi:MAG: 1-acyl-sn-glycerol-3-phosphate acyltransferase [Bacilli bacterium]|nr:1-acyl-sn-glycerol-3-phosphate acyltransferase [Bacilli bacterium]